MPQFLINMLDALVALAWGGMSAFGLWRAMLTAAEDSQADLTERDLAMIEAWGRGPVVAQMATIGGVGLVMLLLSYLLGVSRFHIFWVLPAAIAVAMAPNLAMGLATRVPPPSSRLAYTLMVLSMVELASPMAAFILLAANATGWPASLKPILICTAFLIGFGALTVRRVLAGRLPAPSP